MARDAALRASDADRDAVAERLRAAAVEGRLDADELEQRVHVALRARTYGQLQQLLDDLPDAHRSWRGRPRVAGRPTTTAVVLAVRVLVFLVVATVVIGLMVLAAASWMLWIVVWFVMCGRHRHRHRHRRFAPPPRRRGGGRPASNYIWT
jgi:Flp pilus assembly protein TadB